MACAIDLLTGILNEDDGVGRHFDGTGGRLGGAIGHVVVGGASVVDAPKEIIDAVAIEHIGALAVGVVGERPAAGRKGVLIAHGRHHVV